MRLNQILYTESYSVYNAVKNCEIQQNPTLFGRRCLFFWILVYNIIARGDKKIVGFTNCDYYILITKHYHIYIPNFYYFRF